MSNTDFEDHPNGEAASEELVLDTAEDATGSQIEDDAEDAGDEQAGAQGEGEEVAPRRNRANETIRELRARAQEEKVRADRIEREIMEIKAERQAQQQRPNPQQEQEQLALMTPDERADYKLGKALNELRRDQALTNFRNEDRADKALFDAKATTDKVYAKYATRVEEARLKYMRETNTVIPREELLKHMVGEDVLKNRGKNVSRQTKQGRENIQRQQAPLANGRGNTQADRRSAQANTPQARAARLANVSI